MRESGTSSFAPRAAGALALALALGVAACGGSDPAPSSPDAAVAPTVDAAPAADPTLGPAPTGDVVGRVEVAQYVGLWYEQASIPAGFQANCAATTATYGVIDATTISVLNKCKVGGLTGSPTQIQGKATVVDAATNAKLLVDFGFGGAPYWIVDLAVPSGTDPYAWAVVSNPDRSSLWILSRDVHMAPARYEAILARLTARGFPIDKLKPTAQP